VNDLVIQPTVEWSKAVVRQWDRFWFTPQQPHTLALIRILGGSMLFYTHLVWSLNLLAFLGPNGWLPISTVSLIKQNPTGTNYAWSYLYYVDSPALLWILHLAALVILAMLTLGLYTRVTSILAFIITLSYCHRLEGSLFGLDQINALIATYLMIGPSGAVYSLDRWLARRRLPLPLGEGRGEGSAAVQSTVGANLAIRLTQVHMCVIYLFGGIGKARGPLWWDGMALWFAFATLEYQSLDMTWTVHAPWLLAIMTHVTLLWELSYVFLVWPRLTRPVMLILAVLVHAGIGLAMGMKTFGLMMIIGNLAFVEPQYVQATIAALGRLFSRHTAVRSNSREAGSRAALAAASPASLRSAS
jgi:hypothetical protein